MNSFKATSAEVFVSTNLHAILLLNFTSSVIKCLSMITCIHIDPESLKHLNLIWEVIGKKPHPYAMGYFTFYSLCVVMFDFTISRSINN